jgi:SAM-dependent methyltransferase
MAGYSLDPAWREERARLESLTRIYDPLTLAACERLGLSPGWRCLEVGGGTGSIAKHLAARVGEEGLVVATDVDLRFLSAIDHPRVEVRRFDAVADEPFEGGFDLIHARLLLEHLPQREAVLRKLSNALRPGGWLLVEDLDWSTAGVVEPRSALHDKVVEALRGFFASRGYDAQWGRKLPLALEDAGLREVSARAEAVHVRGDPERGVPQWDLLLAQLSPALIARGLVTREEVSAFHALWREPGTSCFAPLMVSAWGRRLRA